VQVPLPLRGIGMTLRYDLQQREKCCKLPMGVVLGLARADFAAAQRGFMQVGLNRS